MQTKNYTVKQFANELGVHHTTVYNYINAGLLPCLKIRGLIRIRPADAAAFEERASFDALIQAEEQINSPAPVHAKDPYELGKSL